MAHWIPISQHKPWTYFFHYFHQRNVLHASLNWFQGPFKAFYVSIPGGEPSGSLSLLDAGWCVVTDLWISAAQGDEWVVDLVTIIAHSRKLTLIFHLISAVGGTTQEQHENKEAFRYETCVYFFCQQGLQGFSHNLQEMGKNHGGLASPKAREVLFSWEISAKALELKIKSISFFTITLSWLGVYCICKYYF